MKEIKIGLLGFGTVGAGVAKILINNRNLIQSRMGVCLTLKHVADLDTETDRGIPLDDGVLVTDAVQVVTDPEIDIIVEMIGGTTIAKELMLKAIDHGKQIVTANKALLAEHGNEIFAAALEKNVDVAFEASSGGCMPIVKTLRESLVGNNITAMTGILNGTCNYILSEISDTGASFEDTLKSAQEIGYAEADPTLDVGGFDTAHKLAILSALAYGMELNLKDVYTEGITRITPVDIDYARQFGYTIKLLAISKNNGDSVEARVHPTMISESNLLSSVKGALNAISVSADAVKDILLYGRGAGQMPTASAVVSDIADIARNLAAGAVHRIPYLGFQKACVKNIPVLPIDDITTQYYFRFSATDRPGVLSKISGILGNNNISIKSVQQKARKENGAVPLVMLTHMAKEASVKKAVKEILTVDVINKEPVIIRIESDDDEE